MGQTTNDKRQTTKYVALGVNIDHVATLRQARGGREPDPVWAAAIVQVAGADGITIHLREDRRHIQDHDLVRLKGMVETKLNLEMSVAPEIVRIACRVCPDQVTLVPEKRQELTTEGGLDVVRGKARIARTLDKFHRKKITTSLFIDPDSRQVRAAAEVGAQAIELHTGRYANVPLGSVAQSKELKALEKAAGLAHTQGLVVYAGHGLNLLNVRDVVRIEAVEELNIGHSIISRAVLVGLERAVKEMQNQIREAL